MHTHTQQRYLALDDRVAWAYYQFPTDMFNGETMEEWVALSGKQGEGQEGNINIILSFTVERTLVCVYVYVRSTNRGSLCRNLL